MATRKTAIRKKAKPVKQNLVQQYMSETFDFGGEVKTRAEVIAHLKTLDATQPMIDRYLQGLDLRKRLDQKFAQQ